MRLLLLLLLPLLVYAQDFDYFDNQTNFTPVPPVVGTFHSFYGGAAFPDGTAITAVVDSSEFNVSVKNSQYGYEEPLRVYGSAGSQILFLVDNQQVGEAVLQPEGMTRLDFGITPTPVVEAAPVRTPIITAPLEQQPVAVQEVEKSNFVLWIGFIVVLLALIAVVSFLLTKRAPKDPLTEYIKNAIQQGYTREHIENSLLLAGWDVDGVRRAFEKLR